MGPDGVKSLVREIIEGLKKMGVKPIDFPDVPKETAKEEEVAQETSFDAEELTVVWQAVNVEHGCHYCVPAHTGIAKSMKVRDDLIEELRNDDSLSDAKLNTLKETVLAVTRNRGNIDSAQLDAFYSAGYKHQQLLGIILILAQKVMSNYTNHIAETPVDEPFKKFEWSPK